MSSPKPTTTSLLQSTTDTSTTTAPACDWHCSGVKSDCDALKALYSSVSPKTALSSWCGPSSPDPCTWSTDPSGKVYIGCEPANTTTILRGRRLASKRRVTQLTVKEEHLTGTIPDSIGGLSELTSLDLSGNELSGSVPSSVTKLTKLHNLNLEGDDFSSLPDGFCDSGFCHEDCCGLGDDGAGHHWGMIAATAVLIVLAVLGVVGFLMFRHKRKVADADATTPLVQEVPVVMPPSLPEDARRAIRDNDPNGVRHLSGLQYDFPQYPDGFNPLLVYIRDQNDQLKRLAGEARVLVHGRARLLMKEFLALKQRSGSSHERRLYQTLSVEALASRMLQKRPLTFWLAQDNYLLKTGEEGEGGFEAVGAENQQPPLVLDDVISYDEMALSALVSVSCRTPFFNDGARSNEGQRGAEAVYPFEGVYIGAVGARFEKDSVMEYAHMIVTPEQNTPQNGYGASATGHHADVLRLWARFYDRPHLPDWQEAQSEASKYITIPGALLDPAIYKQRLRMSIEPFLLDADQRGLASERGAFVHVVGLGIGAWAVEPKAQTELMYEVYAEMFQKHELRGIHTIDFSWFSDDADNSKVSHGRIQIQFSRRNPGEPVAEGLLLVAMYAWDGNSYAGNEYWVTQLTNSGDPAAACCSAIPLLQNPDWNAHLRSPKAIRFAPIEEYNAGKR